MTAAALVTVLMTAGVYLILQRGLVRAAFGFVLIGHAANIIILAAGGMARRDVPYVGDGAPPEEMVTDPLLQAFALTAIVITFALTVYLLALAGHGGEHDGASSEADPSDAQEDTGTVVDTPGDGEAVGTHPMGTKPTGRTTGKEHA